MNRGSVFCPSPISIALVEKSQFHDLLGNLARAVLQITPLCDGYVLVKC